MILPETEANSRKREKKKKKGLITINLLGSENYSGSMKASICNVIDLSLLYFRFDIFLNLFIDIFYVGGLANKNICIFFGHTESFIENQLKGVSLKDVLLTVWLTFFFKLYCFLTLT